MSTIHYCDNIHIRNTRYGAEYFQVILRKPDEFLPYCASINRYCVPGRIDTYQFDLVPGKSGAMERVAFCSEGFMPLDKALALLQADLDRPQVVELLCETVGKRGAWALQESLIDVLAPKCKALKAMRRVDDKLRKEQDAALKAGLDSAIKSGLE